MRIVFHGLLEPGQQSKDRVASMERLPGVEVIRSPVGPQNRGRVAGLMRSISWRLRRPLDEAGENRQLLALARKHRPDVVYVENSRMLRPSTLRRIRRDTGALLVFATFDDIVAPHNLSLRLKQSFPLWDIFYSTKTFNIDELRALGVRKPVLTPNIFVPEVHRPMTPEEVGPEYEAFDLVFIGTFERERENSLRRLSEQGFKVLVHGNAAGRLAGGWDRLTQAGVTVRPEVVEHEYTRAIHHGKVALGFLRKINRDKITMRSIELPAMGRVMLAEKTDEHDSHFVDGEEYVGFTSDEELAEQARRLADDPELRARIGAAGRARCFASGYDVDGLMERLVNEWRQARQA